MGLSRVDNGMQNYFYIFSDITGQAGWY